MPKSDLPDNPTSDDLADTRTAWAEDRTLLANERTFAGWMRTGMACVAIALGLRALLQDTDYPLVAKIVAQIFVLGAIAIFWAAAVKSARAKQRIDEHDTEAQSSRFMFFIASLLTLGAASAGVLLWLL